MIHNVSTVKQWTKGVIKIGDTLFIDGSPWISCGVCDIPIRKVDAFNGTKHTVVSKGKKQQTIEQYKVMVGYWLYEEDEVYVDKDGQSIFRRKSKPILHSVPSCFDCWQKLQDMKAAKNKKMNDGRTDHLVFYPSKDVPKKESKALFNGNSLRGTSRKYPY